MTAPFCEFCNRARLTADGRLRLCLLRENEVDLLTPLRAGASLEDLRRLILDGIWLKPWGHGLAEGVIPLNRVMNRDRGVTPRPSLRGRIAETKQSPRTIRGGDCFGAGHSSQ